MASLHLRLHLLANSQTINHPPDSAYHSVHTHAQKHASLFIIPVLSATTHKHKIPAKIPPFQRSHSGVNITAHTHPLTRTTPLFKCARLYMHPNHHPQPQSTRIHIQYMCTLAHTCSPKRDSWSYQTKAWESQLSSDGFEMWALPYHLPALLGMRRHNHKSLLPYKAIIFLSPPPCPRSLSLSLALLLFSGGRDEWFQLCATKTKLGTWQFQYGLFICIKLIGCGFDGEVMWLRASQPHGWTCLFVCTQVNNLRLYFLCIARTRYLQIFWKIWIRCSFILFPLSWRGKKNTAHCRAHSIMLVTQKLSSSSSRPWSIRRQLWGRIETLVSLTTSQSIVADFWLVKLARVSVLLLWLCTGFSHIQTTVSTGYRLKNQ